MWPDFQPLKWSCCRRLCASTLSYTTMTVQTVPQLVTLPATAPIEDIFAVLRRDGTIVLSEFVSFTITAMR
jgi:hypothetical protein